MQHYCIFTGLSVRKVWLGEWYGYTLRIRGILLYQTGNYFCALPVAISVHIRTITNVRPRSFSVIRKFSCYVWIVMS